MGGPTLMEIFLGLLPLLLLLGAFYLVARLSFRRSGENLVLEQRKVEALERIAAALERQP